MPSRQIAFCIYTIIKLSNKLYIFFAEKWFAPVFNAYYNFVMYRP